MTLNPLLPAVSYWTWNSQAAPPISGQLRTDSRNWAAATLLYLDYRDDSGADQSNIVGAIRAGDAMRLQHQTDSTRYATYKVTADSLRNSTWYEIAVTNIVVGGTIPNSGTRILVTLNSALARATVVTQAQSASLSFVVQPVPPSGNTITWKSAYIATRPNRWTLTCSCAHGTLTELNATRIGDQPVPPMAVIESTALNLLRRTGCNCAGLVAGMAEDADPEEVSDTAGL